DEDNFVGNVFTSQREEHLLVLDKFKKMGAEAESKALAAQELALEIQRAAAKENEKSLSPMPEPTDEVQATSEASDKVLSRPSSVEPRSSGSGGGSMSPTSGGILRRKTGKIKSVALSISKMKPGPSSKDSKSEPPTSNPTSPMSARMSLVKDSKSEPPTPNPSSSLRKSSSSLNYQSGGAQESPAPRKRRQSAGNIDSLERLDSKSEPPTPNPSSSLRKSSSSLNYQSGGAQESPAMRKRRQSAGNIASLERLVIPSRQQQRSSISLPASPASPRASSSAAGKSWNK
ncbi:unnamed protein product, partial [Polarella glacialis]